MLWFGLVFQFFDVYVSLNFERVVQKYPNNIRKWDYVTLWVINWSTECGGKQVTNYYNVWILATTNNDFLIHLFWNHTTTERNKSNFWFSVGRQSTLGLTYYIRDQFSLVFGFYGRPMYAKSWRGMSQNGLSI